ncbi:MAG TPA: Hsp20/alpha crystallin family protein [Candidatus Dormibacteraeota bacterium]|nr:Hsp20/alpha crystallin family protein [Candidatus Dormibacteraeota bacterium]
MIRWRLYDNNPMREMLEQMLQASQPHPGAGRGGRGEPMPINVHQSETDLYLVAALPGVIPEEIDISYHDGLLTLRATSTVADTEYFHQEIRGVEYFRQIMLPVECRFEEAEAQLENGMLEVRIPKQRPKAPEKIRIQVNRRAGPTTIDAAKGIGYQEVRTAAKPKRRASGAEGEGRKGRPGSGPARAR